MAIDLNRGRCGEREMSLEYRDSHESLGNYHRLGVYDWANEKIGHQFGAEYS